MRPRLGCYRTSAGPAPHRCPMSERTPQWLLSNAGVPMSSQKFTDPKILWSPKIVHWINILPLIRCVRRVSLGDCASHDAWDCFGGSHVHLRSHFQKSRSCHILAEDRRCFSSTPHNHIVDTTFKLVPAVVAAVALSSLSMGAEMNC